MDKVDMTEASLTVQVALKGRDEVEGNHHRAPVAISVVVDTSSSMEGQALELVQKACRFILKNCRSGDMVGLVQYDSNAKEVFPLTEVSDPFINYACYLVNTMQAIGATNMHDGIKYGLDQQKTKKYRKMKFDDEILGYVQAKIDALSVMDQLYFVDNMSRGSARMREPKRRKMEADNEIWNVPYDECILADDTVQSVFLFTDGLANQGPVNEDLVTAVKNMLQESDKVKIHTFGFGGNHDENMLMIVCEASDGKYYYMKSEEEIPAAFADAVGGLQSLAAENLTIEITPMHNFTIAEVCTKGTSMTSTFEDGKCSVSCGSVVCSAAKDLVFKMARPRAMESVPGDGMLAIAAVTVSGMDIQTVNSFTVSKEVTVERVQTLNEEERNRLHNLDVAYQCLRLDVVIVLEQAEEFTELHDYEAAQNYMKGFEAVIQSFLDRVQGAGRRDLCNLVLFLNAKLNDAIRDCDVYHGRTRGGNMKSMKMRNRAMKMQSNDCRDDVTDDEDSDDGLSMAKGGSKRQRNFRSLAKGSNW
jgi:Mg-chelatase subunit ChlD